MHSTAGIHRVIRERYSHPKVAVFLDRDGVIVEETGYLHRPRDVQVIPGAREGITLLNNCGFATIVVTNQAGIARGYYDWPAFEQTQAHIEQQLSPAVINGAWACGYHPDGTGPFSSDHDFRKPNPGMLVDAAQEMNLDLSRSWLVGDKAIDIQAAVNAGLAGAILVRTGYGRKMEAEVLRMETGITRVFVTDSLATAVEEILHITRL